MLYSITWEYDMVRKRFGEPISNQLLNTILIYHFLYSSNRAQVKAISELRGCLGREFHLGMYNKELMIHCIPFIVIFRQYIIIYSYCEQWYLLGEGHDAVPTIILDNSCPASVSQSVLFLCDSSSFFVYIWIE